MLQLRTSESTFTAGGDELPTLKLSSLRQVPFSEMLLCLAHSPDTFAQASNSLAFLVLLFGRRL